MICDWISLLVVCQHSGCRTVSGHFALAESLSMHEGGLWAGFNKLPKSAAKILRDDCN